MRKNIIIYGAGGFGREVAWLIERINKVGHEWNVLGFVDDVQTGMYGKDINNLKLFGGKEWFAANKEEIYVTCPVGSSKGRRSIHQYLEQYPNVKFATLIDPSVVIGGTSVVGEGAIICCGARITVNAKIGKGVVINTGSSIGHNSDLSDFCTLLTNVMVSGTVRIGENSEIGSGAFIREYLTICSDVVVAPLSSVLRDITEPGIYAGNPARRFK
ncbi:MAG: acetyltransferase [bacterium]